MKYTLYRDERGKGGPKLSMCITADSRDEAQADFDARWQQKVERLKGEEVKAPVLPIRTTAQIQAEAMTPEGFAVKRNTKGVLK